MEFGFIVAGLVVFCIGSIVYVYAWRGEERYTSFSQYLRKGWPVFSPMNCLLYLFTRPRARTAPILDVRRFPELAELAANWETIRREALQLYRSEAFDQTSDPENSAYYDVGFRTFYKYGWRKFYLSWYGTTLNSAARSCPETVGLIERIPGVNGAMFSLLPVGAKLTRHADPVACSLRYHLGLSTPNDPACYINIDGEDYVWQDGEAMLFDETYLHFAHNDSVEDRLILMCDINRPTWLLGSWVNGLYRAFMRLTVVPNTKDDQRGLFNSIFAGIAPRLGEIRALKQTDPRRYKTIKYTVNSVLLLLIAALVAGPVWLGYSLVNSLV